MFEHFVGLAIKGLTQINLKVNFPNIMGRLAPLVKALHYIQLSFATEPRYEAPSDLGQRCNNKVMITDPKIVLVQVNKNLPVELQYNPANFYLSTIEALEKRE